jgi:FdhD protein
MEGRPLSGRTARRQVLKITLPDGGARGAGRLGNGGPGAGGRGAGGPGGGGRGGGGRGGGGLAAQPRADFLAAEEPLGIRVNGTALTMTMRTPGDDIELAAGFLVSEAVIRTPDDLAGIRLCDGTTCGHGGHEGMGNIADVTLAPGVTVAATARRSFMTTSACGVCGKASIADICVLPGAALDGDSTMFAPDLLADLPARLRKAQRVFSRTGGLHAAGLFTAAGDLIAVREDVGRHNAVDKVVGWALLDGRLPLTGCALLVSGRASFELVQKAVLAGIPLLAAVSAPSSLAVDLAAEAGLTLVGFLRGQTMNVYAGAQRVIA